MNTPKTMIGLLALGLLFGAGAATALGGTLGGTYGTSADANAHADYSGVLKAVDDTKGQVESTATSTIDSSMTAAVAAGDSAQASAKKDGDLTVKASAEAKHSFLDGVTSNVAAFGSWAHGLFVKPTVDAKHVEDADLAGQLASDVSRHDGKIDAYYGQDLESTARVDYNIPPPPTPSVGFLGEIKMAFEGILHLA